LTTAVYDAAHRLVTVTQSMGGNTGPQTIRAYDSGGRMTSLSKTIGTGGTKVKSLLSYDAANRLGTLVYQAITPGGSGPRFGPGITTGIATYIYAYDNANRVTTETNNDGTYTFTYDGGDELTNVGDGRLESYGYDSNGNRNTTGYTTAGANELTASPGYTYTYDAEGNLTSKTNTSTHVVTTFSYDDRNRMTGVTIGGTATATYTYDSLNRRIGTKVSGTQTWSVYDGSNNYADFNGSSALQERYQIGPAVDELLGRTDSGGTTAWYLPDRLGTVHDITDTTGTVIYHASYDAFGNTLTESGGGGDRFKFTGREYDSAVSLYFYRARYLDPATGRFQAQDPSGFASGDLNLYRYVGDDPLNATDSTGLYPQHLHECITSIETKYIMHGDTGRPLPANARRVWPQVTAWWGHEFQLIITLDRNAPVKGGPTLQWYEHFSLSIYSYRTRRMLDGPRQWDSGDLLSVQDPANATLSPWFENISNPIIIDDAPGWHTEGTQNVSRLSIERAVTIHVIADNPPGCKMWHWSITIFANTHLNQGRQNHLLGDYWESMAVAGGG
jgi:RHS repeat-associated protein